jgi:hypothetical protein
MSDKTDNEWTSHQFVKVCTAWCLSTKATSNRLQRRATNPNACWHPLYFRIPLGRQPVIPYPNRDDGWRLKLATGCIFVLISPALIFLFYFIFPPSFKKERRSSFVLFLLLQKKKDYSCMPTRYMYLWDKTSILYHCKISYDLLHWFEIFF